MICVVGLYLLLDFEKAFSKLSIVELHELAEKEDAEGQGIHHKNPFFWYLFSRNNLSRNRFFFHLLSEKENPTKKLIDQPFRGIFYMLVNNLGLFLLNIFAHKIISSLFILTCLSTVDNASWHNSNNCSIIKLEKLKKYLKFSFLKGEYKLKTRIIQAFIEETRNNGIKFRMDDLAKRLGISKRTLYEIFSSKVDILDSIIDLTLSEFDEQTRLIIDNPEFTLAEKIKKTIVVLPKYNEFYDLRILEQLKRFYPEQWERVNRELNQWNDLKALLEEGIQSGIIKDMNIDLLMKLIIGASNITLDRQFFLGHSISVTESFETIVDVLLSGILTEKNDEYTGT